MNNSQFRKLVLDTPARQPSSSADSKPALGATPRRDGAPSALGSRMRSSIPMTPYVTCPSSLPPPPHYGLFALISGHADDLLAESILRGSWLSPASRPRNNKRRRNSAAPRLQKALSSPVGILTGRNSAKRRRRMRRRSG